MKNNPILVFNDIGKSFSTPGGSVQVLEHFNLEIQENEFVCILGHSGCGKSTLLRVACGLEKADAGQVLFGGSPHTKPSKEILMLFQDFNQLFPWKTVLQNVTYPMKATKMLQDKAQIRQKAQDMLEQVGLAGFQNSYPYQLSGGMKQRAAVARALVLEPKVLLMDEPFASVDNVIRQKLQKLTRQVCKQCGVTVLFVTHSVEEAVLLADRIVVMDSRNGGIEHILSCREQVRGDDAARLDMISSIVQILYEQAKQEG